MRPVRWYPTLLLALAATLLSAGLCLADANRSEENLGWLVVTGPDDSPAPVIEADGLRGGIEQGGRHDGALYYVVARHLWDLDEGARYLDHVHYRLQRILFPVLAHTLHPAPGDGLVWTMFGIGLAGVFLGASATSALSQRLGGPLWPGIVFAVVPGVYTSLRISVPDPLALAFALWAILFSLQRRWALAILAGVLAVLTKESTWLVLVGFAMWRRDRPSVAFAAIPAAVAGAWWVAVRLLVERDGSDIEVVTIPLAGWVDSIDFWSQGFERPGMLAALIGLVLGIDALVKRGLRHPFGWILLIHLVMISALVGSAIAPERSAGRTFLPVMVLAVVALVTPGIDRSLLEPETVEIETASADP